MNRTRSILCALAACLLATPLVLSAQTSTTDWSIAALDEILANVQPGQTTARIDDMEILVSNLRAWRNQMAGGPQPQLAFYGNVPTWTSGNVYYTFDSSVSVAKQKVFLDSAMEWSLFANLHFISRSTQANYVTIVETNSLDGGITPLQGGVSALGMIGGQQFIYFSSNAWNHAIILHELGHTLGLVHEHQRSDRDSYLTVITNNVAPGAMVGLVKLTGTQNQGSYDFLSVMHYAQWAGSINPPTVPTMIPLPPYMQFANIMGQGDPKLTPYDRAGMAAMYGVAPPLTNVVTNTQDSGPGSLRAALYFAYDYPGTTVRFNIPVSDPGFSNGVFNVQPTDVLPSLFNATVLDGTTEPTNSNPAGPAILLSGVLAQPPSVFGSGLRLRGTNCVVRGLIINGFNYAAIAVDGSNSIGNVVSGCYLGVNSSGTIAVTNGFAPLLIELGTSSNTIGGLTADARNIISGGIVIRNPGTRSNLVRGNLIGVGATGLTFGSNTESGITIYDGTQFNIIGGDTTTARNIISGNGSSGVVLGDANTISNVIVGNYIGLDFSGSLPLPNNFVGVEINNGASANVIGGSTPGAGNVISGNTGSGVLIRNPGSSGNVVQGNLIGLNAAGVAPIPNGQGINIYGGAQFNLVGGYTAAARNVISGNGWSGVALNDLNTIGNIVAGNYIGLNSSGTTAVPNSFFGVELNNGTSENVIGGSFVGAGNVISGNGGGVLIRNPGSAENSVQGNIIGLNASGTAARPNAGAGILIYDGARSNLIGGAAFGAANLISSNNSDGVALSDATTTNNLIRGNSMIGNSGVGIALYSSANRSASAPSLTSAVLTTNTTVSGNLTSLASTTFQIDFYSSPGSPAQGMTYLGAKSVTTSAGGSISFTASLAGHVPAGRIITATATDPAGNTSGMSGGVTVTATSSVNDGIPNAWRALYFGGSGTTTNSQSCAACDADNDGVNNLQEFLAGTNPTNAASVLKLNALAPDVSNNVASFLSAPGIVYRVLSRDDLVSGFWSITADQVVGTGTNIFIADPSMFSTPKRFYRLQVLW